ncbi:MAG: ComEC/Rec2 family competence protein [Chitinophagaceae bacterium]|nr:ComEC/Rec2 family competence protein [Chitinophagaceae bacterium]
MLLTVAPIWKEAPFLRVLPAFVAGILLQWHCVFNINALLALFSLFLITLTASFFLKGYFLYKYKWVLGLLIMLLAMSLGMIITHYKNIKNQREWLGTVYTPGATVIASLRESLTEKNKSYKAIADIYAVVDGDDSIRVAKGSIIIYFSKDSSVFKRVKFGTSVLFKKAPQAVKNSGNPGAFDYSRYTLFQGITHQVYLTPDDFSVADIDLQPRYMHWLESSRLIILDILKKYIPGSREVGVAEALLIGYRNDLDRDLVQQYSNTGVIHVIAISGMHLAMIYGLLIVLLRPLQKNNQTKMLRGLIILSVLWSFSLLAGAGASILRSVVMFSFIVIGESMARRVSVYHTLAASAFFLLCWDPFLLWDVGFQLSYAAVLSIVIFLRPITNWLYFRNKIMDHIWKLLSVTMAAQILTTPLSIYHFHQAPNLFLLSNLVVVPLSGIILYGEILLCILSGLPLVAGILGSALSFLLWCMNGFTAWINDLPYAVSSGIAVSVIQVILLYAFIAGVAVWLMFRRPGAVWMALPCLLLFGAIRVADVYYKTRHTRMVVYNVPGYTAIDVFTGGYYFYMGDDTVNADGFMKSFHLTPARLMNGAVKEGQGIYRHAALPFIWLDHKKILLADSVVPLPGDPSPNLDVIVLSGTVTSSISRFRQQFRCSTYVFDASCPAWKINKWKNECDSLLLRRHSVAEDGAFILD